MKGVRPTEHAFVAVVSREPDRAPVFPAHIQGLFWLQRLHVAHNINNEHKWQSD